MLTVLRREEKYALSIEEAICYANRFAQLMMSDQFSKNGKYVVRSLYFDTMDDKDFHDKLNEQNQRRKVRLRIYSPDDQYAKLELKQKENVYQKKRSLSIRKEDALALIDGNYSVLLSYKDPFADEMFTIMSGEFYRPKSVIEYQRQALIARENSIRITFDSCIQATEYNFDLFSPSLPLYPVLGANKAILEIKYNHFLPAYLSDILSQIDRRSITASKYCMGRQFSYTNSL